MTANRSTSADRWPSRVPFIIGNEACERFSFYGMKSILAGELSEFLIEAGNDTAFQAKLASLITHRETLQTWREKFRDRALHDFSFESSMQRYLDVLTSAVKPA